MLAMELSLLLQERNIFDIKKDGSFINSKTQFICLKMDKRQRHINGTLSLFICDGELLSVYYNFACYSCSLTLIIDYALKYMYSLNKRERYECMERLISVS